MKVSEEFLEAMEAAQKVEEYLNKAFSEVSRQLAVRIDIAITVPDAFTKAFEGDND